MFFLYLAFERNLGMFHRALVLSCLIVLTAALAALVACGELEDAFDIGADDSCDEKEYHCTCTCYTPIGNVDRGYNLCACDPDEAYSKACEKQDDSPCGYGWSCHSCYETGDDC